MKMFPLIFSLILVLISNAESGSAPGVLDIDTHVDTGTAIIGCYVSFNNFTRIQIFHSSVKVDGEEDRVGKSNETWELVSVKASSSFAIFTGGFGILKMEHKSVHFNLPPGSNKSIITVINNTDVEVHWQGPDRLLIKNHMTLGHADQYQVRVYSVEGLKDKVIILLAANGQRVAIDVSYEPLKRTTILAMEVPDLVALAFGFFIVGLVVTVSDRCEKRSRRRVTKTVDGTPYYKKKRNIKKSTMQSIRTF